MTLNNVYVRLDVDTDKDTANPGIKTKTLDSSKSWIKSLAFDDLPGLSNISKEEPVRKHMHAGLIYYLHYCWAKEYGCVIRPDMLWFTIISEIARAVFDDPDKFADIFTDTPGTKQDVTQQVDNVTDINVILLAKQISNKIQIKELSHLILNTRFNSEVENAHLAVCSAFSQMASPYFNYITFLCGIKSVNVKGSKEEYITLMNSIEELSSIFLNYDSKLSDWLTDVSAILNIFIQKTFNPISTEERKIFFNDMFHYSKNNRCGSGHIPNFIQGWIQKFYYRTNSKTSMNSKRNLNQYPTHIMYTPYKNTESNQMFIQLIGLSYSDVVLENNDELIIEPKYSTQKFEVLIEETFNKLASINNT